VYFGCRGTEKFNPTISNGKALNIIEHATSVSISEGNVQISSDIHKTQHRFSYKCANFHINFVMGSTLQLLEKVHCWMGKYVKLYVKQNHGFMISRLGQLFLIIGHSV